MAIDWSPLVASRAIRNQNLSDAVYGLGDTVADRMKLNKLNKKTSTQQKPKRDKFKLNLPGFFKNIKDKMTDQEGLFQGGIGTEMDEFGNPVSQERNRMFGRLKDAAEGIGQIGYGNLKTAAGLPSQFIKGMKDSSYNNLDPNGVSEERPDKKSLMDFLKGFKIPGPYRPDNKGITKYGMGMEEGGSSFDPNVQPIGQIDDNMSLNDQEVMPSTPIKNSSGLLGQVDDGLGELNSIKNSLPVAPDIKQILKPSGPAKINKPMPNNASIGQRLNNLKEQYPNFQTGSVQPGQSYEIDLGDGQGMQYFKWGTGPIFGE